MMRLVTHAIRPDELREQLLDPAAGAYAAFEGWIRNENDGHRVVRLEYEAYAPVAAKEGGKVLREAETKFPVLKAFCVHRTGMLEIGECAVWVGVSAPHRDEARSKARRRERAAVARRSCRAHLLRVGRRDRADRPSDPHL